MFASYPEVAIADVQESYDFVIIGECTGNHLITRL